MKLNGTHKFTVPSTRVFDAILDPQVLKAAIPGCESVMYASPDEIAVNVTTPLPGLHGPFGVTIQVVNRQAPNALELRVQRKGRGGSVDATSKINLADEADGALLTYEANAELQGLIAMANNPIGKPIVNNSLNSFFKNLDKAIV